MVMFKKISPYLDENVFKLLDKDMLVTAGKGGDVNTMTASWGHLGIIGTCRWRSVTSVHLD